MALTYETFKHDDILSSKDLFMLWDIPFCELVALLQSGKLLAYKKIRPDKDWFMLYNNFTVDAKYNGLDLVEHEIIISNNDYIYFNSDTYENIDQDGNIIQPIFWVTKKNIKEHTSYRRGEIPASAGDEIDCLRCQVQELQAKLKSLEVDRRLSCYKIIYELAKEDTSLLARFFRHKANSKDAADSLKTGYHVSKGSLENVRADMEKVLKLDSQLGKTDSQVDTNFE